MAFLILVAGHETTVDLISGTVHALLTYPDQLALLRAEPGLTGPAVGVPALQLTRPRAASEISTESPASIRVPSMSSGSAAKRNAVGAVGVGQRIAGGVGHGPHHCLGTPLARAEATVAVSLLLRHRPALAFASDPGSLAWRSSTLLRGLAELPLRFG
nr:cytochrome P450 [Streptomyces canus]